MAQINTLFAFTVNDLTPAEESWLRTQIELLTEFFDKSYTDRNADFTTLAEFHEYDHHQLPFEYRFDLKTLTLYSNDGEGSPEVVATLLWLFLKTFRPKETIGLTIATTCSRPISGAFGGAAIFIASDGWDYFDVAEWLEEKAARRKGGSEVASSPS
jgi:hypothetical protein